MKQLFFYASKYPWLNIALLILISLVAASRIDQLDFSVSVESMLMQDDPSLDFYYKSLDQFGSDTISIVYLEDSALFSPAKLTRIQSVIEEIESLPYVRSTDSLFNINEVKVINDEVIITPYLSVIPDTLEAAAEIRDDALRSPFIHNNLLSTSGHAMAINIYLDSNYQDGQVEQLASQEIDQIIAPLTVSLDRAFQIGAPYIRDAITDRIFQDMVNILPLALGVLLLTLGFTLRRLTGVLIPLFTASLSVIWTLGLMAHLGIPINAMTSIIPALLVIIGSTEDIHLLAEYYSGINKGMPRKEAIYHMGNKMGVAVFLTFITTYMGFLSISLNRIDLLREFGLVASSGLLFNFAITIFLIPAILRLIGDKPRTSPKPWGKVFQVIARFLYQLADQRTKTLIVLLVLILGAASYYSLSLKVDNTTLDYFDPESEIIQHVNKVQDELAGMQTLSIIIESGIDDTFLKVRYLEEVQKLQTFLLESGIADKTLSFVDYLSFIHVAMEEDNSGRLYLPETDDIVREYMLFVKPELVKSYITQDFSTARIFVRHQLESSYAFKEALHTINSFVAQQIDTGLRVTVTGQSVLGNRAADHMASAQIKSLLLMSLVIFLIVSLLFLNLKAGLLAVIPNAIPILVLFGVMGYFDIPLNAGTALTAAIALGICVDDTMHFMVRYHSHVRDGGADHRILDKTVDSEAVPIVTTSISLALGFSALAFSYFPPIATFGLLSALVMLMALVSTFVIIPTLLSVTSLITVWDVLSVSLRSQMAERSDLFAGMSNLQVRKVVLLSQIKSHQPGEYIIRQGDLAEGLFVILDGTAERTMKSESGARRTLDVLSPGEIFNEAALSHKTRCTEDILASSSVQSLFFNRKSLAQVQRMYPRVVSNLFNILEKRNGQSATDRPAVRDETSMALKYHVFDVILEKEIASAQRYSKPLALLLFEVTPLESIIILPDNIQLEILTSGVLSYLRKEDSLAHWADNIFAVLLPNTEIERVVKICCQIRESLAHLNHVQINDEKTKMGFVTLNGDENMDEFTGRAEECLNDRNSSCNITKQKCLTKTLIHRALKTAA